MDKFDRKLRRDQFEEEQEMEQRKKTTRGIRILLTGLLFVAVVVTGIVLIQKKFGSRNYRRYEVISSREIAGVAKTFKEYPGGYLCYDTNGAQAFREDGTEIWNVAYNFKNPVTDVCGDYTVIADKGNKSFYIVDGKGTAASFEIPEKILDARVAKQGVAAVMVTGTQEDHVYLYDATDKQMLVDIKTMTKQNGFPVTLAISPDGKKLVTSYVSTERDKLVSWVTFYNFGDVGKNGVDNMVGSYSFEAVVPEIHFCTSDTVAVVRDNGITLYEMEEVSKTIYTEDFTGTIVDTFASSGYIGFVVDGQTGQPGKRMIVYSASAGKKVLEAPFDAEYREIRMVSDEIIYYDEMSAVIMQANGKKKYQGALEQSVNHVFSTNSENTYLLVSDSNVYQIRLIEVKE